MNTNENETTKTELVFILDKSGSMSGLESDTIDNAGDISNLLRTAGNFMHGLHHIRHHFATFLCRFRRTQGQLASLTGILSILFHGGS